MSGLFLLIVESLLFFVEWNVGVLLYITKTNISVLEKRNFSSTFSMISRTVFLRALIRKTIKHTKREIYSEPPRLPHLRAARHIWVGIIQLCPLIVFIFGILPAKQIASYWHAAGNACYTNHFSLKIKVHKQLEIIIKVRLLPC